MKFNKYTKREREREAKKLKKSHKSCRLPVGNGGGLGVKRKKRRKERVGPGAANPNNLANNKEAGGGAQGTQGFRIETVERVCPLCRV